MGGHRNGSEGRRAYMIQFPLVLANSVKDPSASVAPRRESLNSQSPGPVAVHMHVLFGQEKEKDLMEGDVKRHRRHHEMGRDCLMGRVLWFWGRVDQGWNKAAACGAQAPDPRAPIRWKLT